MERLRVPINAEKTRSMRVPEEPLEFLGYRIGRNYRPTTGRAYIGTRPSRSSVVSVCHRISELTHRGYGLLDSGVVVRRLNRVLEGVGELLPTGTRSVRPTGRSTGTRSGGCVSGCGASTRYGPGSTCASRMSGCGMTTASPDWYRERHAFRGRRHDLVREPGAGKRHAGFDERGEETWLWWRLRHRHVRKPPATATPPTYGRARLSSTPPWMIRWATFQAQAPDPSTAGVRCLAGGQEAQLCSRQSSVVAVVVVVAVHVPRQSRYSKVSDRLAGGKQFQAPQLVLACDYFQFDRQPAVLTPAMLACSALLSIPAVTPLRLRLPHLAAVPALAIPQLNP